MVAHLKSTENPIKKHEWADSAIIYAHKKFRLEQKKSYKKEKKKEREISIRIIGDCRFRHGQLYRNSPCPGFSFLYSLYRSLNFP
jgi:hypothetical protein